MRISGVIAQLRTTDLAESIRFYTTKVGLTLDFQYEDFYAGIRAGDQVFHLKRVDDKDPSIEFVDRGDHFHLYLETDDVAAAADALRKHGVRLVTDVHDTPWGTRELAIKDDQGHTVYFGERREVAEASKGPWVVQCEWGPRGLAALAPLSDVVVIVDVLSFSTCVEIAVSRGAVVFPYAWRDERAAAFARDMRAERAGPRGEGRLSLSPASFLTVTPGARVVLPSPNGATLSQGARSGTVLTGCLRNAAAVAQAAERAGRHVLVLAAGEQWPDGSLRPCVEDWLAAGAIVDALSGACSPEAEAARAAFRAVGADLPRVLAECTSGQQLLDRGYADDVALAAALNVSDAVPVLREGAYHRLEAQRA